MLGYHVAFDVLRPGRPLEAGAAPGPADVRAVGDRYIAFQSPACSNA